MSSLDAHKILMIERDGLLLLIPMDPGQEKNMIHSLQCSVKANTGKLWQAAPVKLHKCFEWLNKKQMHDRVFWHDMMPFMYLYCTLLEIYFQIVYT